MARKRSRQSSTLSEILSGFLALAGFFLLTTFQRQPLFTSLICGFLVALLTFLTLWIWQRRRLHQLELAIVAELQSLTPKQFEYAVAELFRAQGFHAVVSGGRNDRGVDIRLRRNGEASVVQCKRYKKNITPAQIREFAGAIGEAGTSSGYFVTTSDFTRMAREAAKNSSASIHLINRQRLGHMQRSLSSTLENHPRATLLPYKWWAELLLWQKGILLGPTLLLIWVLIAMTVYIIGLNFF